MRTARLRIDSLALAFALAACNVSGSWTIGIDGDARYHLEEWTGHEAELHMLGLLVRKTLADDKGDRLTVAALAEAEHNFENILLHELSAKYKGPLGRWNITAGRFIVPYGLLKTFDATRQLYESLCPGTIGFHADNGLMLSGVLGRFDYALSVTQGYGAHHVPGFPGHGFGVARLGIAVGETDEIILGISGAYGETSARHHRDSALDRGLGGIDATLYAGPVLGRAEVNAGFINGASFGAGFAAIEYAIVPRLDAIVSGTLMRKDKEWNDATFVGLAFKPKWFTIRGGYRYVHYGEIHNRVSFQLYRLFSFAL
ncbi:MAG: hypothetical protein GF418_03970 [Chitinivibrionales bacterium]|nr:hypothetical protein [Chitinivibrionales bacterium]MBD3394763.1 hypothetical protein [Chitinivibrionales bacterium]